VLIPASVAPVETLVRGILRPLFYSSHKLKPLAFMPPPGRADVSMLRLAYTNANFCKQHASTLRIPNNDYTGLASLQAYTVSEANELAADTGLTVQIAATPIKLDNTVADFSEGVTTEDDGLPMHADILYSQSVERGVANPAIQLVARHLLSKANYYSDPDITASTWTGPDLLSGPYEKAA
jgi:hypothetical protein